MYVVVYVCICVCMYACMYVCMWVCVCSVHSYVRMCVCTCVLKYLLKDWILITKYQPVVILYKQTVVDYYLPSASCQKSAIVVPMKRSN